MIMKLQIREREKICVGKGGRGKIENELDEIETERGRCLGSKVVCHVREGEPETESDWKNNRRLAGGESTRDASYQGLVRVSLFISSRMKMAVGWPGRSHVLVLRTL